MKLRSILFGLTALAGIALASTSAQANCTRGNCWGAVAYSENGA